MLNPATYAGKIRVLQHAPSPALAEIIDYFWSVCWSLPDKEVYEQFTLPSPNCTLAIDAEGSQVYGVFRGRFCYRLQGRDCVVAAKFHVGAFRGVADFSLHSLCDQKRPASEFFGESIDKLEVGPAQDETVSSRVAALDAFLCGQHIPLLDGASLVRRCVDEILRNATILRAQQVADFANLSLRSLQRYFKDLVGVSPKWVIRRFRLQALAEVLEAKHTLDLSRIALDLGYSDQAHLTRDFRSITGITPKAYADRNRDV